MKIKMRVVCDDGVWFTTNDNNLMTFDADDYRKNEEKVKKDIANFVAVLIKNGQEVKITSDGCSIGVEYNYAADYGNDRLYWLTPEEAEYIESERRYCASEIKELYEKAKAEERNEE